MKSREQRKKRVKSKECGGECSKEESGEKLRVNVSGRTKERK